MLDIMHKYKNTVQMFTVNLPLRRITTVIIYSWWCRGVTGYFIVTLWLLFTSASEVSYGMIFYCYSEVFMDTIRLRTDTCVLIGCTNVTDEGISDYEGLKTKQIEVTRGRWSFRYG